MSRLGMDADAVEAAGRELGGLATQVQRTVQDIDRLVTSLPAVWLGPSVTRYVHQWEGGMRWQTLGAMAQTLLSVLGAAAEIITKPVGPSDHRNMHKASRWINWRLMNGPTLG